MLRSTAPAITRARVALIAMAALASTAFAAPAAGLASQEIYWGARIDGDVYGRDDAPWDLTSWNLFEQHAGKQVSLLHFGQLPPWKRPFDRNPFNLVTSRGAIPYVSMSSESVSLTSIANGTYDNELTAWARDVKAYGKPFLFRWNWEMNGTWFSWGAQAAANPGAYVAAWRRFHDIATAQGAINVTWVWCPNAVFSGSTPLSSLYPGDGYVDWTCADVYNFGSIPLKNDIWKSFYTIMKPTYDQLVSLAPAKPILLGELASTESGGSKSAWISDALTVGVPVTFPKIRGVAWMNWNILSDGGRYDWQIESSASAQSAFASAISLPNYVSNDYGSLPVSSKVAPPRGTTADTPGSSAALPTPEQIEAALRADLAKAVRQLRRLGIRSLVRRRGFTVRNLDALLAGRFTVTLRMARKVVLAKGSRSVPAAGRYALKVKLTHRGRRILRGDRRAKVTFNIAFRDVSGRTTLTRMSVRLRR